MVGLSPNKSVARFVFLPGAKAFKFVMSLDSICNVFTLIHMFCLGNEVNSSMVCNTGHSIV